MGEAIELGGRVEPLRPLRAPLSGATCAIYRVELCRWQRLREGLAGRGGATHELAGARFALRRPGSPTLLVDPRAAEIELHGAVALRRAVLLGVDAALDARLAALYVRLGRAPPPGRRVACRERRLDRGDFVWVCGELVAVPAADGNRSGSYREPPQQLLLRATHIAV